MAFNVRTNFSTLNEGGIARLVCIARILARASPKVGVTFLMRRILEACSWRLTTFAEGYAASDEEGFPQILTLPLRTRRMVTTGLGLGLLPTSLFRVTKTITTSGGVRFCHTKVWAMML